MHPSWIKVLISWKKKTQTPDFWKRIINQFINATFSSIVDNEASENEF